MIAHGNKIYLNVPGLNDINTELKTVCEPDLGDKNDKNEWRLIYFFFLTKMTTLLFYQLMTTCSLILGVPPQKQVSLCSVRPFFQGDMHRTAALVILTSSVITDKSCKTSK